MINAEAIENMKEGVLLINTGRGQLIDTRALINGLKKGRIGGAGLDVYEEEAEYFFEDFSDSAIDDDVLARLMTFPNVLITSHQAFFTREALQNIADTTLGNADDFFHDRFLENEICYRCGGECVKPGKKRCF
jgi:D-lactate dehydrogenase